MGTGKIILPLILLFILASFSMNYAQAEYVQYDHPVYDFLERMNTLQIISNYNSLERPQTRHTIADFLKNILEKKDELNTVDKSILDDFVIEFEYDIYGTLKNSQELFSSKNKYNVFSNKECYLYTLTDSSKASIFVNFIGSINYINAKNPSTNNRESAEYLKFGGIIRGTFLNRFGFSILGTNGPVSGSRTVARNINEVNYDYKFNQGPDVVTASNYIDHTEGYLTADFDIIKFKIGSDRKVIGFGPVNYILGDNTLTFDQISMNINYKLFSFSFFHGKLLGSETSYTDSIQGNIKNITEKYIGYHRLGFNFSKNFSIGLGEMIVYSGRSPDFSYLNPFNFYKSAEHANQDRDNSLLFVDIFNNSIKGLKLFGGLLIDDIDFGKLGTGWYGNEILYNFTLYSANLYKFFPLEFYLQYLRIDPYVYTHRIYNNNYTNFGLSLASPLQPNSDMFIFRAGYTPFYRLNFTFDFSFKRHGANIYNSDGTLLRNVGGDVLVGHRDFIDSNNVTFLDGNKEYYRSISLFTVYRILDNYFLSNRIRYDYNSFYNSNFKNLLFSLGLDLRI